MSSEIADLLQALRAGDLTLEEVAQRFRKRKWPRTKPPPPASYHDLAAAALRDPDPDVPGSFDEVVAACDRGEITETQYQALADAAAEAKRARNDPDG